jgi:hypothetical protein
MKQILLVLALVSLIGCSSNKLMLRTLDSTIIEAAERAKRAGAKEITLELSIVSAYKGKVSLPISVVTVGGETSLSNTTKVTVKIDSLAKWKNPDEQQGETLRLGTHENGSEYFILDTKTFEVTPAQ